MDRHRGAPAAVLEFIPMIGPLAVAVLVAVVSGLSGAGVPAVVIFMAVYRLFQDYVLAPHVMGKGVEMHPLTVPPGVFAGAGLAGVAGAFLPVPVPAVLRVVYRRMRKSRLAAEMAPVPSV